MEFLLSLCRADVDLDIEEFNVIGSRVPLLANLKPHGKVWCVLMGCGRGYNLSSGYYKSFYFQYHMADLDEIGGLPVS